METTTEPTTLSSSKSTLLYFLRTRVPKSVYIGATILMLVLISWIGYATSGQYLGAIDQKAQVLAKKTVEQTAAAFLLAKSINGALSVASTFTVGAGAMVNGSIEPGKVLDPFDRLIDDFSDYLLLAATAATLTELILVIDSSVGFSVVVPACVFLGFIVFAFRKSREGWKFHLGSLCQTALAFTILFRFAFPMVMILSHQGYETFLAPHYEQAKTQLNNIQEKTKLMYTSITSAKDRSDQWVLSRWIDSASDKVDGVRAAAAVLKDNFEHFFDAIFTMTAIMALEILLLPIALGWMMWRLTRRVTGALWYGRVG